MPYYIYRVHAPQRLEYLEAKSKYREARSVVRDLRSRQEADDTSIVRMIFARTTGEAEKLLSAPRDDRIIGED